MTDDRLYEIVSQNAVQEPEISDWMYVIRLALAERDREVAEWAECGDNHFEVISAFDEDQTDTVVYLSALLHFLEAQP